ncbi:MAG: NAD(P)-dependent oxidoreductase [Rhodospirillaceae bacterium]|nr:NAD(P)-dependent oxidoreductase [Rhodospirillaceae bacterium]MBT4426994.1 NAD(P)-dependent oxidoreductase [Rhodospirillaceae bacterium]
MIKKIESGLGPVGVAGCGRMGAPMARALIRAGFDVAGLDILPAQSFGDLAPHMSTADDFAAGRRVVLSVVRDAAETEELLFDDQALLSRQPSAIEILLICSTLSPRYVADLRARVPATVTLVDAPMSGAAISAEEARLSFMLGGAEEVLDHLQPLLDAMGDKFHRMGPYGAGMTAKVLNNFCAASSTAATRTVLRWAERLGVDEGRLLAVLNDSSGQNWLASNFSRVEFARDGYSPDNTVGILAKDLLSMFDALPEEEARGLPAALLETIRNLKPIA